MNIDSQTNISVSIISQGALSEVVVTALGIRRSDKALGYSVAKVDPNAIVQKSEPDVLKSLEGKVAGVDIRRVVQSSRGFRLIPIERDAPVSDLIAGASNAEYPVSDLTFQT